MGTRQACWPLLLLALQGSVRSEVAPELCPVGCHCDPHWPLEGDTTFKVECGKVDWLLAVPDWSPLRGVQGKVFLCLHADQLPQRLRREDLPSGLQLVALQLSGADWRLAADTLANVGSSLEWLELVFPRLELRWSLPFLAGLPKLRTLKLHFDTEDPLGGEVAGAPFRGLGLRLALLSIRGGHVTGLGPQVLDGLAAEMVSFRQNKLTAFPGEALRKVEGLINVNIYRNPIKRLKDGDTDGLNLTSLTIAETHVSEIADAALSGLRDTLTSLSITECRLGEIPVRAVAPLRALRKLEMIDHPIASLQTPLQGDYCLERVRLGGGSNGTRLREVGAGVLAPQGACLENVALYETELPTFPTAAFTALDRLHLLYVESSALTRLQAGAMAGVGAKKLSVAAPLDAIEPGAFLGMRVRPLELTLMSTHLRSVSFFYEYQSATFFNILVVSSQLPCDCELAGVRVNLRRKEVQLGGEWLAGDLNGECLLGDQEADLQSQPVLSVFGNCTNVTLLEPEVSSSPHPPGLSPVTAALAATLGLLALLADV